MELSRGLFARFSLQLSPQLFELDAQCGVIESIQSAAGQYDRIETCTAGFGSDAADQFFLMQTKTFAD